VLEKLDEELGELREAMAGGDKTAVQEEFGDLLFTLVNLSRHLGLDAETALRAANRKFETRFRKLEQGAAEQGHAVADLDLKALEALWQAVKAGEKPLA
jgi:ATP diphosphatase